MAALARDPGETGEIPVTLGREDAEPRPAIVMAGLCVVRDHGVVFLNPAENSCNVMAKPGARVLVNGRQLAIGERRELHHHDTLLFGCR